MEQGNRLDSTLMSVRQDVDVRSGDKPALEAAITGLLTQPSDGTAATQPQTASSPPSESTDMASACIEQVKRMDAWNADSDSLTEEEGNAEMERWRALFRRMIDTPSTSLRDLAGKAHLMQADLDGFEPLRPEPSADEHLLRVILAEAMAFGDLTKPTPQKDTSTGPGRTDSREVASHTLPALVGESIQAEPSTLVLDPGRALAARVIEYFGDEPILEFLTADIEVRDMARALLEGTPYCGPATRTEAAPDPILAAIATTRVLMSERHRAGRLPQPAGSIDVLPEQDAATDAFFEHVDDVLLQTVPTTAAGCGALARYAGEFLETEKFCLDESTSNDQHVRVLDLIARSPMLGSVPTVLPSPPDFTGSSITDLYRTYNAFKLATDIMGLTGWTTSPEGVGDRLLNAEADRLSHFQNYIADELARREPSDRIEAGFRGDVLVNRAVACGHYDRAAEYASEADAKRL